MYVPLSPIRTLASIAGSDAGWTWEGRLLFVDVWTIRRRVVIEKPFGHDLTSAQELNAVIERVFPPDAVFRIDHYLGKEMSRTCWSCASRTSP